MLALDTCPWFAAQGKWAEISDLPGTGPPPGARGLCPQGGFEYATAVFHYARALALAAKAEGAAATGDLGSAVEWYASGAIASLDRLRVSPDSTIDTKPSLCKLHCDCEEIPMGVFHLSRLSCISEDTP